MDTDNSECKPKAKEKESKHHSADFNCHNCSQTDCCYWALYNEYYIIEDCEEQ